MSTAPRRIGQYELAQQIGSGHVGEVMVARDLAQRRDVAIKLLHNDLQADPNFLNRLTHGGKALTSLHHKNLVSVYDAAISRPNEARETTAFIVMDYIEGFTLTDYIKATAHRGIFPSTPDIAYLFSCLGTAVDYIHQQGITHGDIKPNNILLHKHQRATFAAGEPMLTDIGMTQIAGNDSYLAAPHYLSPEQAQGQQASKSSDIYALGIILYEICTGAVPFRGDNAFTLLSQHINTLPTPPMLLNPYIPPALAEVILRALAKDPAARFSEGVLFAYAIAEACSVQPTHPLVRQIATRKEQSAAQFSTQNQYQSILGVSQPLSSASPVFMRSLSSGGQQQSSVPGQMNPVSLNANPDVSAAVAFPNASPHTIIPTTPKTTGPISTQPAASPKKAGLIPTEQISHAANDGSQIVPLQPTAGIDIDEFFAGAEKPAPDAGPLSSQSSEPFQRQANSQEPNQVRQQTPPQTPPLPGMYQPGQQASMPGQYPSNQQNSMSGQYPSNQQNSMPEQMPSSQASYPQAPMPPTPLVPNVPAKKNQYVIFIGIAVVIALILGTFSLTSVIQSGKQTEPTQTNNDTAVAIANQQSPNAVFFQDDALGHLDQLKITLQNVDEPPQGNIYYGWLQTNRGEFIPLGDLQEKDKQVDFMYGGTQDHTNLLSNTQGITITLEALGSNPKTPAATVAYQASFSDTILPELKNILITTPEIENKQSVIVNLFETIKSMNDKAVSVADSVQQTSDYNLAKRQSTRIIEMIDGSAYAKTSGDLPANLPSQSHSAIGLLSSPNNPGLIEILSKHLETLKAAAGNDTRLLQRIQNAQYGLTDLTSWLQTMRNNNTQILKSNDLKNPQIISAILQVKQLAAYSYTGRTIPPDTAPKPTLGSAGAQQTYTEIQYLAALTLQKVK